MKFTLSLLAIGLALIGVLGCKKEAEILSSQQVQPEPRTLRIYCDGVLKREIDVTDWEVNEDVVVLDHFYYPWQGEDSINYDCYLPFESEKIWGDAMVLNVNGKMVGVSTDLRPPDKIARPEDIKTVMSYYDDKDIIRYLKFFPNLIGVRLDIDSTQELKRLDSIPKSIRLYLDCYNVTNSDLRKLSLFPNIRVLYIVSYKQITNFGLRYLTKLHELRGLRIIGFWNKINPHGQKYLNILHKLRYVNFDDFHT